MTEAGSERRRHERFPIRLPVTFEFAGTLHEVTCLNVSAGGMYLETADPPPLRSSLSFRVWLGDANLSATRSIALRGTVVRFAGGGIGIQFDTADDFTLELLELERFLAHH